MINSLALILMMALSACAGGLTAAPAVDESGAESARPVKEPHATLDRTATAGQVRSLSLNQTTNVRKMVGGILEFVVELPPGSVIQIPESFEIVNPDYRTPGGATARSSTGFVGHVTLISTPGGFLSQAKLDQFNQSSGGLYISASVATAGDGVAGNFKTITGARPEAAFKTKFEISGQPKFTFTKSVMKRFGARLNQPLDSSLMSPSDRLKYQRIYAELKSAGDRKIETAKSYLLVDHADAMKASILFETNGSVAKNGAWSIAVGATAVRHGFDNVPCAEFMSETVREAYERAGYSVSSDFNPAKGNQLIWKRTNAVVVFSQALYDAGWIPYEPRKFKVPTGALMMNGSGETPGHTFLAAGDDGQLIVDNGSPQGRDLRTTSKKILDMMYETGVFFLPPGIAPDRW